MRRVFALLLAAIMLLGCVCAEEAMKAPDYTLEGLDTWGSMRDWDNNLFFSRMEDKTGIRFQFNQYKDANEWTRRKETLSAANDLPDVLFKAALTPRETEKLYADGIIIDLKPYLEEYAPDLWALLKDHPEWEASITLADGSIPALPAFNLLQDTNAVWINTSWLETLKLEMPTTADELTEVLRAFKTKDPNRNNRADEIPLTFLSVWELRFLGHAFGIIDNDYYVTCRDGKVTSGLTTDENRAFLTWLHGLWEEGLIDRDGFATMETFRQITDEKTTIPYGIILSNTPMSVVPSAALTQYTVLPPLIYEGKQVYRDLAGDVVRGTFALTKECKDPEKMVAWVNTLYTDEGSRMAQAGLENEEYIWNENNQWEWTEDAQTVATVTLAESAIVDGGAVPGLFSADFQLQYYEDTARTMIESMYMLKQYEVEPYPQVFLSEEDEKRITELMAGIGYYAEQQMASFIVGDDEINDENWNVFSSRLKELGLDEMIGIWQKYAR